MWATRYFNVRYWAERYWPKVGANEAHVLSARILMAPARAEIHAAIRRSVLVPERAVLAVVPDRGTHG
jgi:hypothetical protein